MDKPGAFVWFFGKLTIIALVLLLLGASLFWTFIEKKGVMFELTGWPQENKYLVIITYFYLVSSYFLSILSVAYVLQSPKILEVMADHPKEAVVGSLIVMTILTALLEYTPYNKTESLLKNGLWTLHSTVMGPAFAYFGPYICAETAIKLTWAITLATIISFTAPKDTFIEMKAHIHVLYSAVTITSILCFLFTPPANVIGMILLTCNLYGGIILYFGVLITNTQYMLKQVFESDYDPVYTAAIMYLSTLNLCLRVAMYHVVELTDILAKQG